MDNRTRFEEKLKSVVSTVYYSPPESYKMNKYPCILYFDRSSDVQGADNRAFIVKKNYSINLMLDVKSLDEEETIISALLDMGCRLSTTFFRNGLKNRLFQITYF